MKRPFCSVCGSEGDFPGHICPACSRRGTTDKPGRKIPECPSCGRIYLHGRWQWKGDGTEQITCPDCHKLKSGIFVAVVQLPEGVSAEEIIERELAVDRRHGKFSALVKVDGTHYKFSNVSIARRIARVISKKLGLDVKETAKLTGYDARGGKGIYKVAFSVLSKPRK